MKKAIIVFLVAVVAMTAAFANSPDKNGFAFRVDFVGLYGEYGIEYNLGAVRLGVGYLTLSSGASLYSIARHFIDENYSLPMFVVPIGVLASVDYKFIATDRHELSAGAKFGYAAFGSRLTAMVDVEYGFCFNMNNAAYVRFETIVWPYVNPLEGLLYLSGIGYRYTF